MSWLATLKKEKNYLKHIILGIRFQYFQFNPFKGSGSYLDHQILIPKCHFATWNLESNLPFKSVKNSCYLFINKFIYKFCCHWIISAFTYFASDSVKTILSFLILNAWLFDVFCSLVVPISSLNLKIKLTATEFKLNLFS